MNDNPKINAIYEHHEQLWSADDSMDGAACEFAEAMCLLEHMDGVITDDELIAKYEAWCRVHTL